MKYLSLPQKLKNTICEHNCANWTFFVRFFSACLLFGVFAVTGFFGGSFFERNEKQKKTNSKQNNKKQKNEEGPQDANKRTT